MLDLGWTLALTPSVNGPKNVVPLPFNQSPFNSIEQLKIRACVPYKKEKKIAYLCVKCHVSSQALVAKGTLCHIERG
jgi:hypothetical protein